MASLSSEQLLVISFGILTVGAVLVGLIGKSWRAAGSAATVFMAAASIPLWTLAARALTGGPIQMPPLIRLVALNSSLQFRIDSLSAIFLIIVPFVALAATLYAVQYMNKMHPQESPRRYYPFVLLLMAAIVGVLTSSDLLIFFIFWELMTLTSWVVVWFDREDSEKVRAAWQYFMVTHVAAACMLVAILVTYGASGSFAFGDVAAAVGLMAQRSPAVAHIVMALFLIGFLTKAGMFPLGGWLPAAYPAAPSPASAAFAGSMTKLGIYGVVRVTFEFFGADGSAAVWGAIIAVLGAVSIFVGTLTALRQDDSKRILAFHMIGQTGYMLLGIGTARFFLEINPALAALALIAGLYHVINNACYKSLLFLNVGAVEYRTGTRDLNMMGGLGAMMPITAGAAIVASLSIAGIPPFNGFASKWLIYQTSIRGGLDMPLFLILGLVAMFISLVTLASFLKLLSATFLGKPAPYADSKSGEVPVSMAVPQIALAAACVLLGVVPILPLLALYGAAGGIVGAAAMPSFTSLFGTSSWGITLGSAGIAAGAWNPAVFIVVAIICGGGAYGLSRLGRSRTRETVGWYCGEEAEDDEIRYRAHGFVLPFKEIFGRVYPTVPVPKLGALAALKGVLDLDRWLFDPIVNAGGRLTDHISRSHSGLPQMYMLWQGIGVVAVLVALFVLLRG
jgi:hydrogenase-4 component B